MKQLRNGTRRRRVPLRFALPGLLCHLVAGGLVVLPVLASAPARAEPDVLARPAVMSVRARSSAILAVAAAGTRLVAVGERGVILVSDDDGRSWRQMPSPVSVSLTNLFFVSPREGWATGHSGVVLHTADGGEHWDVQIEGKQAAALIAQAAQGASADWERREAERLVEDGPDKPFLTLWFSDARHGMVFGAYGMALATEDGGQSWQSRYDALPNRGGKHLYGVDVNGDVVTVVGEQGAVFRSTDSGLHFAAVQTSYQGSFFGLVRSHDGALLLFGLRGTVLRAPTGAEGWTRIDLPEAATINAGTVLSDGTILLADQAGHVFASRDDGRRFRAAAQVSAPSLTAMAETPGHALVLGSMDGPIRLDLEKMEQQK